MTRPVMTLDWSSWSDSENREHMQSKARESM